MGEIEATENFTKQGKKIWGRSKVFNNSGAILPMGTKNKKVQMQ